MELTVFPEKAQFGAAEEIAVRAEIREIAGFSAHADQAGLLNWLKAVNAKKPKQVFLTHGEPEAIAVLKEKIGQQLGLPVEAPEIGAEYDLDRIRPEVIKRVEAVDAGKVLAVEVNEAFDTIKNQVYAISRKQGQDRKVLEKLLAKIHDIEGELARINQN